MTNPTIAQAQLAARIGEEVFAYRHELGITQRRLGELIGATEKTISRWECGACLPSAIHLEKIKVLLAKRSTGGAA